MRKKAYENRDTDRNLKKKTKSQRFVQHRSLKVCLNNLTRYLKALSLTHDMHLLVCNCVLYIFRAANYSSHLTKTENHISISIHPWIYILHFFIYYTELPTQSCFICTATFIFFGLNMKHTIYDFMRVKNT